MAPTIPPSSSSSRGAAKTQFVRPHKVVIDLTSSSSPRNKKPKSTSSANLKVVIDLTSSSSGSDSAVSATSKSSYKTVSTDSSSAGAAVSAGKSSSSFSKSAATTAADPESSATPRSAAAVEEEAVSKKKKDRWFPEDECAILSTVVRLRKLNLGVIPQPGFIFKVLEKEDRLQHRRFAHPRELVEKLIQLKKKFKKTAVKFFTDPRSPRPFRRKIRRFLQPNIFDISAELWPDILDQAAREAENNAAAESLN